MTSNTYRPQFLRLFEFVNTQSAQLVEGVFTPPNQRALLDTRGTLHGLQLQADVLRYHLNRNLCRREDAEYLLRSWQGMAARLIQEAYDKPDAACYLNACATALREGASFFKDTLLQRGEFEHQLDDDGELQQGCQHCKPPLPVWRVAHTPQESGASNDQ